MRLDRYIANRTGISRKDVSARIRQCRVKVDGVVIRDKGCIIHETANVTLDDVTLPTDRHLTLMLHKPAGVITATRDRQHRTVLDLLSAQWRARAPRPVGRLDLDTTGLLILTTDGDFNHTLTHPRHKVGKCYRATLSQPMSANASEALQKGVTLRDGTRCKPAQYEQIDPATVRVTIVEGQYHQVKRMIAACGGKVEALHRERIGDLSLPPDLLPGLARPLTPDEHGLLLSTSPMDLPQT